MKLFLWKYTKRKDNVQHIILQFSKIVKIIWKAGVGVGTETNNCFDSNCLNK